MQKPNLIIEIEDGQELTAKDNLDFFIIGEHLAKNGLAILTPDIFDEIVFENASLIALMGFDVFTLTADYRAFYVKPTHLEVVN